MVLLLSSARGGGPACRPGEINILLFMAKQPQVVSFVSFREDEGEGVSSLKLIPPGSFSVSHSSSAQAVEVEEEEPRVTSC